MFIGLKSDFEIYQTFKNEDKALNWLVKAYDEINLERNEETFSIKAPDFLFIPKEIFLDGISNMKTLNVYSMLEELQKKNSMFFF